MIQLELLTIRQQPAPREIPISSRVIRQYVKEKLLGFAARQIERERRRIRKEARRHMRAIKVTYRATFQQPIGKLNPMGVKLSGPIAVEIFGTGERWQAREYTSGSVFTRLGRFSSVMHAIGEVPTSFQTQVQPWQIWGTPPGENHERILAEDELAIADGKVFFRQAEDYTHIIHAPSIPPGARIPPAACGAQVNTKCFISTKANVEPSCKACAEVWRKEYKGK